MRGTREKLLNAALDLLADSPDGDVSTRAVCEAAGVGAPALYRAFGDKDGLLAAAVETAFQEYLAAKRTAPTSRNPVNDLRAGWDGHMAFALANPKIYRLLYSPGLTAPVEAVEESFGMLRAILERCASAGLLRLSVDAAAQVVMAANVGLALNVLTRPTQYEDPGISETTREAVVSAVLVDGASSRPGGPGRGKGTKRASGSTAAGGDVGQLAATLEASVGAKRPAGFSSAEAGLLREWLRRLADPGTGSSR